MDWGVAVTLTVLAIVIIALSLLRTNPDLILLGGLSLLILAGVIEPSVAFAGFGNEGLITVAVLYVVAEGLRQTGAVSFIGQQLLGKPRSLKAAQTRVMVPTAIASAFLNNTPVVAMMLPVLSDWAKKHHISVSHLFIPLSYAAILGGMCTLIGTSTTLVVNGLLIESDRPGLQMFEIAWIGIPSAIAGIIYIVLCSRFFLPERKPAITPLDDPREFTVEMLVEANCPLIGKTIQEAGLRHLPGMYLMEIDREGHVLPAVSSNERLQANDRLVFVGIVESVVDLRKIPGLVPATDQVFQLAEKDTERRLIEAVVSNSCPYLNMTIREARFRSHYNAAVIAVARNGQRVQMKIGDIQLCPGDTLLLEAHPSFVEIQRNSRDFFLVSEVEDSATPRHERAWLARVVLAAMVIVVAFGLLEMLQAALIAASLMLLTRCCRGSEARQSIDWSVLLVMGAGMGIGKALEISGAARVVADGLIGLFGTNPWLVLAMVYLITMLSTNVITAKAAAFLIFPIALAVAENLHVDHMPFVVAVMIAAAASFATPIGYQTNLMVYGPGGYRYNDYLRLGGPLSLIVMVFTVIIAPIVWPMHP